MQVDELLKPFPIKEFHPFPRALLGPGSHGDRSRGAETRVQEDARHDLRSAWHRHRAQDRRIDEIPRPRVGTGSETSWAYVITDTTTDPDNPHKYVAFDDASVTTLAIDDPVLYYDCPIDYTAQCGFDVLAHASEPYVSRLNFDPSLGNARHAIKLTSRHLRAAVWNGRTSKARRATPARSGAAPRPAVRVLAVSVTALRPGRVPRSGPAGRANYG